jgi:FMN phosphatase YigB (HAD superfamily)
LFKAVLFDLDGTLLKMDTDVFLEEYLRLLAQEIASYQEPAVFVQHLLDAIRAMINNLDSAKTNQEVFMEEFFARSGLEAEVMMPVFDSFYRGSFRQLQRISEFDPVVPQVIEQTLARGCRAVIATNPVFPKIAVMERLSWAGISQYPYDLITSYENMHFCKPRLEYYREVSEMIGIQPAECLMVGNDVEEDLVAKEIGMKTFLVDTFLINRREMPIVTDYRGSLTDYLELISRIPKRWSIIS